MVFCCMSAPCLSSIYKLESDLSAPNLHYIFTSEGSSTTCYLLPVYVPIDRDQGNFKYSFWLAFWLAVFDYPL